MGLVLGLLLLIALALLGCAVTSTPNPQSAAGSRPKALTPAGTEVGGLVRPDTTWTAAGSPYIVTATVQVPKGVTLVIEPGVVVEFHRGLSLQVHGTLVASGTVGAPITFASGVDEPAPGDWESILFANSSLDASYDESGSYLSGSILEHCTIESAGAGGSPALKLDHAGPFIHQCTIKDNAGPGIWAHFGRPRIVDNNIVGNTGDDGGGVYILAHSFDSSAMLSGNTIKENSATGNGGGIYIDNLGGTVTLSGNTVSRNTASGDAGGIYLSTAYRNSSSLSGNTIVGNRATGNGGGVYLAVSFDATASVWGNTVLDNAASGDGGAFYIENSSASVLLRDNNLVDNTSLGARSSAVYLQGDANSRFTFTYNNLWGSGAKYLFYNGLPAAVPAPHLQNNWWGTGDPMEIQARIYGGSDDNPLTAPAWLAPG